MKNLWHNPKTDDPQEGQDCLVLCKDGIYDVRPYYKSNKYGSWDYVSAWISVIELGEPVFRNDDFRTELKSLKEEAKILSSGHPSKDAREFARSVFQFLEIWIQNENLEPSSDCEICGKEIDNFSGNPDLWGLPLPYKGGNGELKYYHRGCIAHILASHLTSGR